MELSYWGISPNIPAGPLTKTVSGSRQSCLPTPSIPLPTQT